MADSELQSLVEGLGPESQDALRKYLFWSKKKQSLHIKDIEGEIYEFKQASLVDEAYNKTDVADLLSGLLAILKVTVEKDQRETTHAFAELLRQALRQADAAGVSLGLDLGPLDNPSHMASMAFLEQNVLEGKGTLLAARRSSKPASTTSHALAPISAAAPVVEAPAPTGPSPKELELETDLARLQDKLSKVQQQYTTMMQEKSKLSQELAAVKDGSEASMSRSAATALALEKEVEELKAVLAVKEREITASQQQLTGKLADSTQFKTLKKLLAQKTQHVKALREKLAKYEPDSAPCTLEEDSSSDDD